MAVCLARCMCRKYVVGVCQRRALSTLQSLSGNVLFIRVLLFLMINLLVGDLSEEQRQLQDEALKFAKNELAPGMRTWDRKVPALPTP